MHRNRTALISSRCEMHLVEEKVTAPPPPPPLYHAFEEARRVAISTQDA